MRKWHHHSRRVSAIYWDEPPGRARGCREEHGVLSGCVIVSVRQKSHGAVLQAVGCMELEYQGQSWVSSI